MSESGTLIKGLQATLQISPKNSPGAGGSDRSSTTTTAA
jgi:hypothetical protein